MKEKDADLRHQSRKLTDALAAGLDLLQSLHLVLLRSSLHLGSKPIISISKLQWPPTSNFQAHLGDHAANLAGYQADYVLY